MNHELAYHLDEYIKEKRYRLINSVLLIVDGETVIERYYNRRDELSRNNLKSMWKSILSLCAGICLDRGLIARPDQPVADFLPQFAAGVHPYHRLITVEHLLTMSSGIYWNGGVHYHCPMMEQICRADDQLAEIADVAMSDLPGTRFDYKEFDVILLSALLGRAVGGSVFEFCRDKPLLAAGYRKRALADAAGRSRIHRHARRRAVRPVGARPCPDRRTAARKRRLACEPRLRGARDFTVGGQRRVRLSHLAA